MHIFGSCDRLHLLAAFGFCWTFLMTVKSCYCDYFFFDVRKKGSNIGAHTAGLGKEDFYFCLYIQRGMSASCHRMKTVGLSPLSSAGIPGLQSAEFEFQLQSSSLAWAVEALSYFGNGENRWSGGTVVLKIWVILWFELYVEREVWKV